MPLQVGRAFSARLDALERKVRSGGGGGGSAPASFEDYSLTDSQLLLQYAKASASLPPNEAAEAAEALACFKAVDANADAAVTLAELDGAVRTAGSARRRLLSAVRRTWSGGLAVAFGVDIGAGSAWRGGMSGGIAKAIKLSKGSAAPRLDAQIWEALVVEALETMKEEGGTARRSFDRVSGASFNPSATPGAGGARGVLSRLVKRIGHRRLKQAKALRKLLFTGGWTERIAQGSFGESEVSAPADPRLGWAASALPPLPCRCWRLLATAGD